MSAEHGHKAHGPKETYPEMVGRQLQTLGIVALATTALAKSLEKFFPYAVLVEAGAILLRIFGAHKRKHPEKHGFFRRRAIVAASGGGGGHH